VSCVPYIDQMIDQALRLSIRPPTGGRGVGVVFGLVLAGFGAMFAAVAWMLAQPEYVTLCPLAPGHLFLPSADCVRNSFWYEYLDPSQLISLAGVPLVLAGAALTVSALRSGVWLAGTTLVVRGLRTWRVDLSTAAVAMTVGRVSAPRPALDRTAEAPDPTPGPVLEAYARVFPVDARVVELTARNTLGRAVRLSWHPNQLPGIEARRLATAITESRPDTDADARRVAAVLRTMASDTHPAPAP